MNHQATALSKTQSPVPPTLYSPQDLTQLIVVSLRTVRSWIRSTDLLTFVSDLANVSSASDTKIWKPF